MRWGFLFRVRQDLKGNLWLLPLAGGIAGLILSNLSVELESRIDVPSGWHYSTGTALSVLTTVIGATVGLAGFVVTVTVLVVQMATNTFSARYMRLWYRDGVLKAVLAVLVGTFAFAYSLLRQIEDSAPNLGVSLAGVFLGLGLVLFLVFLNRFVHRLRPVAVAALVAGSARRAFGDIVAASTQAGHGSSDLDVEALLAREPSFIVRTDRHGAIQAVDLAGLVRWATRHRSVLVVRHAAGDFLSTGTRLIEVYGSEPQVSLFAERQLRRMVALGVERTVEQDPAFALRILVDIAIKALSAAINDPTTAVQVIDHLEDTLVVIGSTPGLDGHWELRDGAGELRVVLPAHRWDDYLSLGLTEIREYGFESIQVMRRLRASLGQLREVVQPEYVGAIDVELEKLEASMVRGFEDSVDLAAAGVSDRQGIGGPPSLQR